MTTYIDREDFLLEKALDLADNLCSVPYNKLHNLHYGTVDPIGLPGRDNHY